MQQMSLTLIGPMAIEDFSGVGMNGHSDLRAHAAKGRSTGTKGKKTFCSGTCFSTSQIPTAHICIPG